MRRVRRVRRMRRVRRVRRGLEEGEIKDQRESIIVPIILLTLHFTAAARHS